MRKLIPLYIYLVGFIIIFSSGAILDQKYPGISQRLFILLCIPLWISLFRHKKYTIIIFLFTPIYIFMNYIIYSETIISYNIYLIKVICMLAFVSYCVLKEIPIFKVLNNIIIGIATYSLFTYIFLDLFTLLPYANEVINSKPYRVFLGLHFHGQFTDWYSFRVARNNSIFWEPGVYQIFLNFALIYQLFFVKKIKKMNIFILAVNLITTFSTTGLIFSLLLFYLKIISIKSNNIFIKFIKYYTIPVISILSIFIVTYLLNQKISYGTRSYDLRANNLLIGLELFIKKPFYGWGFLNYNPYEAIAGIPNNSNGLVSMLFHQGIMGVIFFFVPFFSYIILLIKQRHVMISIVFVSFFIVSCSVEPIMYTNFISLFVCLGLAAIGETNRVKQWTNSTIVTKRV